MCNLKIVVKACSTSQFVSNNLLLRGSASAAVIVIVIVAQGISQQYNQLRVASDGLMAENEEMRGNIMRRSGDESCEGDAKNDENREMREHHEKVWR